MDTGAFYKELMDLNYYEQVGQKYFERYGREMDHGEFIYLYQRPRLCNPVQVLGTAPTQIEVAQIRSRFRAEYEKNLPALAFIDPERDIVMEQLLRHMSFPLHRHDFIEMVCVLSGECIHIINDHRSLHHAGDITLIPPGIDHELHASPDCVCLTTKIRKDAFLRLFSDLLRENSVLSAYFAQVIQLPYYSCALTFHGGEDPFFRDAMLRMYWQESHKPPYAQSIMESTWQTLFAYYLQNYQGTVEFLVYDTVQQKEMQRILTYIFENYQSITLTEVARHFNFSLSYLSSRIHELTGSTFSALLKQHKLRRSAELLRLTNLSVEEVCAEVGYTNSAQFIRSFKAQYGTTPGQYRREQSKSALN